MKNRIDRAMADRRKRIMDRKWKGLESKGIKKPESAKENELRIKEAHVGRGSIDIKNET